MKARCLTAGSAIATWMWTATATAQSVTTAPFAAAAPALSVTALFSVAVMLTGAAWYCLRRRANRLPGVLLAALALAAGTVAVKAVQTTIEISDGDCLIEKTNPFDPNDMTILASDCRKPIAIIALENPCTGPPPPCIAVDRPLCHVGLILGDGESCDLPYCPMGDCDDGMKNQDETDVDCGGDACDPCGVGKMCETGADCATDDCSMGSCSCPSNLYTFTVNSNSGGVFDSAEWPGGTASQEAVTGCSVTINRPNDNIDLVCALANPFSVNSFVGYSTCAGSGGEDGDGCSVVSCPPAGVGSCCMTRPSCSVALNGSAQAQFFVQCNP